LSVFSACEGARSNKFGRATQELPKLLVKTHQAAIGAKTRQTY
jgi:hypothetical protein